MLPYAFDTNDMRFQPGGGFVQAEDFSRYCLGAFARLAGEPGSAVLSIGLHLRIIGRPGRIAGLEELLAVLNRSGQVWFARRRDIATFWRQRFGSA